MVAGETFTVKAVCGNKSYTREGEIPAERSLKFTEGNLGTFSVDMTSATVENISAFAEGQYAVIAMSGSKYYAMAGVKGSGNYMTYAEVEYDGKATTFTTADDTLVWNIKAVDGGYTIHNHEGKYLYYTGSSNAAYLGDAKTLTLTLVSGTAMQYNVGVKDNAERILAFNTNSGQERFAFYKGTQEKNLFLVPVAEDTTPRFTVDKTALEFAADGGSQEITVTLVNTTDAITAAVDNIHFTVALKSGTTYTVTAPANETEYAIEGNLKFTAGELTATVALTQAAKPGEGGDEPVLVEKTATLSFASTAQRTSQSTSQQVWEQNGIKLINDKGSGSDIGNYSNPARFYKNSKLTLVAPGNIKSIKFVCNSGSYATAMKDSVGTVAGAEVTVSGSNVTVTFTEATSNEFIVASLTGGQVRMNSLSVTYMGEEE